MGRSYWMFVDSPENFEITKDLGVSLFGFARTHRRRVQRMQPDDRVLFYVTGIRKWTAIATISSRWYEDHSRIWVSANRKEAYPCRVKLNPSILPEEEDYIDALVLAPRLEYVKRWPPEEWQLAFFGRLHLLPQRDFRLIEGEMTRNVSRRHKGRRGGNSGEGVQQQVTTDSEEAATETES